MIHTIVIDFSTCYRSGFIRLLLLNSSQMFTLTHAHIYIYIYIDDWDEERDWYVIGMRNRTFVPINTPPQDPYRILL